MAACEHQHFDGHFTVIRLTDGDGGPVTGYTSEVTIKCRDCGMPFCFVGLVGGSSPHHPTVSVDNQTARMPIAPKDKAATILDEMGAAVARSSGQQH